MMLSDSHAGANAAAFSPATSGDSNVAAFANPSSPFRSRSAPQ